MRSTVNVLLLTLAALLPLCANAMIKFNSSTPPIHKCCPQKFQLVRQKSVNDVAAYTCIWEKFANSARLDEYFMSYNIQIPASFNIPKCDHGQAISQLSNMTSFAATNPFCIDFLQREYVVVQCNNSVAPQLNASVFSFRKCCDRNSGYNIYTKECVNVPMPDIRNQYLYHIFGSNPVVFRNGNLHCNAQNEILVEYGNVDAQLHFENNHLRFGTDKTLKPLSFCFDFVNMNLNDIQHYPVFNPSAWIIKVCRPKSICQTIPCAKKCCAADKYLTMDFKCKTRDDQFKKKYHNHERDMIIPTASSPGFGIFHYFDCSPHTYPVARSRKDERFITQNDGTIFLPNNRDYKSQEEFCIENYEYDNNKFEIKKFDCSFRQREEMKNYLHGVLRSISCSFLLFTMIVYAVLPNLLNLHGKTLMGYLACSAVGQLVLAVIKFNASTIFRTCMSLAYTVYFSFLGAFSWLNVMCFDIYWTLSSFRVIRTNNKYRNWKRYLFYSLYGWGVPLSFTAFVYYMDTSKVLPMKYQPGLGITNCWFRDFLGYVCYFFAPFLLQVFVNLILYYFTTKYCNQVKDQLQSIANNDETTVQVYSSNKMAVMMNTKLFIVMGVPWSFELLDMAYPESKELCWVWETLNMLMGVCVCVIFVFKTSVVSALRKRLNLKSSSLLPNRQATLTTSLRKRPLTQNSRTTTSHLHL